MRPLVIPIHSLYREIVAASRPAEWVPVVATSEPHVWRMLAATWQQVIVEFRYLGGPNAGERCRVTPSLVFRLSGCSSIYLAGYCHRAMRQRIYCLDLLVWPLDC